MATQAVIRSQLIELAKKFLGFDDIDDSTKLGKDAKIIVTEKAEILADMMIFAVTQAEADGNPVEYI